MPTNIDINTDEAAHCYHAILYDVPLDLLVSKIAPLLLPSERSSSVARLKDLGCQLIPFRLHVFKESLPRKIGIVAFIVHQLPEATTEAPAPPEAVHALAMEWFNTDLTNQLASVNVRIKLGQPPDAHTCVPFMAALQEKCSFFSAGVVKDAEKVRTFVLSKVEFNATTHTASAGDGSLDYNAAGLLRISSLSPEELLWLSREHQQFPSLPSANESSEASTDNRSEVLRKFLHESLSPLIHVVL
ncbi:hypothetical protein ERJ75_001822200 [Trypanosoma vivax]|nr:hypothetical protein TRVL_05269 [Trypanosoma vivax]KAH8603345.1 hypothetical protein ERJ75_001822200 [Trypanosoma vivax]